MPARLRLALFVTGLIALAAIAGVLLFAVGERVVPTAAFAGASRPPDMPRTDFGLRDEQGKAVRLADMRGKPVVVTFLYTTCRDTCPLTAQQIRIALDDLGHDVPVVAVSVDPANDTPRRAQAFLLDQGLQGRMRWRWAAPRSSSACGGPTASSRRPRTPSTRPRRSCSTSVACSASASRRAC